LGNSYQSKRWAFADSCTARFIYSGTAEHQPHRATPDQLKHLFEIARLPLHHRDPFDRLLIAQALVESIPIISADPAFDQYPIERIW
jgi:PIN domain nuclease of toxin-antitoxin system